MIGLLRYDIPRQSVQALLLGVGIALICGLIITFFWRALSEQEDEATRTGYVEGRAKGTAAGRVAARDSGSVVARDDLAALIARGAYADGYALAFAAAWNEAIEAAIDQAAHTPNVQLRRMAHWEALLR